MQSHNDTYLNNLFNSQKRLKRLYLPSKYQLVQHERCVCLPQSNRWSDCQQKKNRVTIFFSLTRLLPLWAAVICQCRAVTKASDNKTVCLRYELTLAADELAAPRI